MPEKIADAVQPDAWYEALPRPQYATLEAVEQPDPWFSVYRLPHDVYAIYEPGHFQEVISYLVLGGEKALLIDTGMGMGLSLIHISIRQKPTFRDPRTKNKKICKS